MKIAFFGPLGAFDYFKIGGMESLTRRLAAELLRRGHRVGLVLYGAPANADQRLGPGIILHYRASLGDALATLSRSYEQVFTIYLPVRDRFTYLKFRRAQRRRLRFHQFYSSWPDSGLKRRAVFADARLYPFNGRLFCISPRLLEAVSRWSEKGALLLPPVPAGYFVESADKSRGTSLRVTYIGRTEPAKGIEEVLELHRQLRDQAGWALTIHGFHYRERPDMVRMHEQLSSQKEIRYVHTPFAGYSPEVDENLARVLADTDVLLLPYRRLSSTMDTPVLLCEGMASLSAVLTRPLGDIPALYGASPFLYQEAAEMGEIIRRALGDPEILTKERRRLVGRNRRLALRSDLVADRFLAALGPEEAWYSRPGKEAVSPGELLRQLFSRLQAEGVAYAVLRNYEGLPEKPGRDVDVLTGDFPGFQRILEQAARQAGYGVRIFRRYDCQVKFFLLSISGEGFASLEMDVAWDIRWKGIPLIPKDFLAKNRLRRARVDTLRPGAEAVVTLTKGLLFHGEVQQQYRASLPGMVREGEGSFISCLSGILGEPLSRELAGLTRRGEWRKLADLVLQVKRQAVRGAWSANPLGQLGRWAAFVYQGLWKFFHPGGRCVALIGPDGSGKSTTAEGLLRSLKPLFHGGRSYHAHFKILPRLRDLAGLLKFRRSKGEAPEPENPAATPVRIGRFRSICYLIYYTLDYLLGYAVLFKARGRGELIVFDRYFYDYLIQSGLTLPPQLVWGILSIIPPPDAVIYLQNDPETILSRKHELSRQEVERQAQLCRELISRLPQGFTMPTTGSPAETAVAVSNELIKRVILGRPSPSRTGGKP